MTLQKHLGYTCCITEVTINLIRCVSIPKVLIDTTCCLVCSCVPSLLQSSLDKVMTVLTFVGASIKINLMTERPTSSVTIATSNQGCTSSLKDGLVGIFTNLCTRIKPHQMRDMTVCLILVNTDFAWVIEL